MWKKRHREGVRMQGNLSFFPPLTAAMPFLPQWRMRGAITAIPRLYRKRRSMFKRAPAERWLLLLQYTCEKKKWLWRVKYATTALPSVWAWSHLAGRLFTQGWVQNNSLQCSSPSLYVCVCVSLAVSNANTRPHWHYFSILADEVHRHCSHEAPCLFRSAMTSSLCYPGYSEWHLVPV